MTGYDDPWADDPYGTDDGPVGDPWATDEDAWTNQTDDIEDDSEETPLHDDARLADTEISVTLKQHGGFDAPWIVVRATSAEKAKEQLQAIVNGDLTKATAWAANQFAATKPNNTPQATPAAQPAPQRQGGGGGGDGRTCVHGPMVYRTGTNKFGKPYEAYFCPTPKNTPDQCKAQFV